MTDNQLHTTSEPCYGYSVSLIRLVPVYKVDRISEWMVVYMHSPGELRT